MTLKPQVLQPGSGDKVVEQSQDPLGLGVCPSVTVSAEALSHPPVCAIAPVSSPGPWDLLLRTQSPNKPKPFTGPCDLENIEAGPGKVMEEQADLCQAPEVKRDLGNCKQTGWSLRHG